MKKITDRLLDSLDKAIENGEITEKEAREILRDYEKEDDFDIHNHA